MIWWHREVNRHAEVPQPEPTQPVEASPQLVEMVDLLRSAAMLVGPHDEVLHSNPQARHLGLCRGDRVVVTQVLHRIREVRRLGETTVFDTEVARGPGAPTLHLNVRISPLSDATLMVLVEDRTPLLRVDETRRDFVANVGHELKTPIGAIQLLSEAVEQAADDPDAVRHFVGRMHTESVRLGELVTQIIDLSRLQSDDPMLRAEPLEVADLVDHAVQNAREMGSRRKVNLVRVDAPEPVEVLGDEHQLVDALTNLVTNAIVYSDPGARVAISTALVDEAGEQWVEVSVADNGIGISPENQERIFERFYRVDYGRSREHGGTGLGLSIVKHICAVHGGSVNVWSKLGQGSTFTVRLPRHEHTAVQTALLPGAEHTLERQP
ncbi:ATP-binding protein [Luteococcus peritonei]